jgi:hypothetical protein
MLCKRCLFALTAALVTLEVLTGAHAQSASVGRTLQLDNTAYISVDYDYPGYYGYRKGYYGDGLFALFEIPGAVIGGVADLLTGAPGDTYYGGSYYSRPLYVSPFYDSPYRSAYSGGWYYDRLRSGSYYYAPHEGSRRYNDDHRNYDDRTWFSGRRYYGDYGYYGDRRYFSGRGYDGDRRYYDDRYYGVPYYAHGYNGETRYGDEYNRGRASYDADDDDD